MSDLRYEITTDERELDRFFMLNDLEYSDEHPVATDRVRCWRCLDGALLVGGVALALRQGEYIIDGIAVDKAYRKSGAGAELLERATSFAKESGARRIYLVARAPEFFRRHGFKTIEKDEAPNFFECLTCPQCGQTCYPEVMKLEVI